MSKEPHNPENPGFWPLFIFGFGVLVSLFVMLISTNHIVIEPLTIPRESRHIVWMIGIAAALGISLILILMGSRFVEESKRKK